MNVYEAIMKAADTIEARPELYSFYQMKIGEPDCPACMWGHIGRALGMAASEVNCDVATAVTGSFRTDRLYDFAFYNAPNYITSAADAAKALRLYAAKYHAPTHPSTPAFPM